MLPFVAGCARYGEILPDDWDRNLRQYLLVEAFPLIAVEREWRLVSKDARQVRVKEEGAVCAMRRGFADEQRVPVRKEGLFVLWHYFVQGLPWSA